MTPLRWSLCLPAALLYALLLACSNDNGDTAAVPSASPEATSVGPAVPQPQMPGLPPGPPPTPGPALEVPSKVLLIDVKSGRVSTLFESLVDSASEAEF